LQRRASNRNSGNQPGYEAKLFLATLGPPNLGKSSVGEIIRGNDEVLQALSPILIVNVPLSEAVDSALSLLLPTICTDRPLAVATVKLTVWLR
jgi:hypothetical protein